jgi:hypothetical protein
MSGAAGLFVRSPVADYETRQVKSLEEAIAWVKRAPNHHAGDSEVEIRQVFEMEDFENPTVQAVQFENSNGPPAPTPL